MIESLIATTPLWLVHGLGFLGFLVMAGSFQSNNRVHILYWHVLALGLIAIHLTLLGGITGGVMMAVLMVRNLIFAQKERFTLIQNDLTCWIAMAVIMAVAVVSYQNVISLFAIAGSLIATYGFWLTDERKVRIVILIAALPWFPYALWFESYSLLALQLFVIISILIAMWRYDRGAKKP